MNFSKIALVALAASFIAGPSLAQDPSYLGGKARTSRYVPAPAPVPETFNWYMRLDLGVGTTTGGGRESGFEHGLGNGAGYAAGASFFSSSDWYDSNSNAFFQGGIGFGKYISPRLRVDATLDVKTADSISAHEVDIYPEFDAPGGAATGRDLRWTFRDRVDVTDGVGLVNAYLDLVPRGRFTPYVGIGAGFAVRHIERTHSTVEQPVDVGPPITSAGTPRSWSESSAETKIAPAVSATAGLAWALSPGTILDVNYRYTYIGGVDSSMSIDVPGLLDPQRSKIKVDASHQHAIRAGLRWNIW